VVLQALANFTKSDLDTMGEQLGRDMFRQIQHLCNAHSLSERAKWLQQVEILENLTTPQLARRVASAMKTLALGLLVPSSGRGVESLAVAQPVLALLMATRGTTAKQRCRSCQRAHERDYQVDTPRPRKPDCREWQGGALGNL
jgi:hypothetical protein